MDKTANSSLIIGNEQFDVPSHGLPLIAIRRDSYLNNCPFPYQAFNVKGKIAVIKMFEPGFNTPDTQPLILNIGFWNKSRAIIYNS
jgi:hypothetical protein